MLKGLRSIWRRWRGATPDSSPLRDRAADVDRAIHQTSEEVARFRQELAASLLDERRLERDVREAVLQAAQARRSAGKALDEEDETRARERLTEADRLDGAVAAARKRLSAHGQVVAGLRESLRLLSLRLDDAVRRRNALAARRQGARAKQALADSIGGARGTDAFREWEEEVRSIEADARISLDLGTDLGSPESEDDRRYRAAAEAARVEESLRALRTSRTREGEGPS